MHNLYACWKNIGITDKDNHSIIVVYIPIAKLILVLTVNSYYKLLYCYRHFNKDSTTQLRYQP